MKLGQVIAIDIENLGDDVVELLELTTDVRECIFACLIVSVQIEQLRINGRLLPFTLKNDKFQYFCSHSPLYLLFDSDLASKTSILLALKLANLVLLRHCL